MFSGFVDAGTKCLPSSFLDGVVDAGKSYSSLTTGFPAVASYHAVAFVIVVSDLLAVTAVHTVAGLTVVAGVPALDSVVDTVQYFSPLSMTPVKIIFFLHEFFACVFDRRS